MLSFQRGSTVFNFEGQTIPLHHTLGIFTNVKVCHSELVLWVLTSSDKMHALMEFQTSGAYEKRDIELTLKAKVVLFCNSRPQ